jgi:hypothetical protein
MAYFDELSDLDFEEFVADLLSEVTKLEFRAGARRRGEGVDLEALVDGDRHLVQCQHRRDSSYSQLKAAAQRKAKGLVERSPRLASYRFATSHQLSHDQRKEIAEILEPWVGSVENVYDEGDLRRHLKKHHEVERRNVKLWLRSADQLRESLSAASYEHSRTLLEETRRQLPRYVQTESFLRAQQLLEEERVCVIAGPAGVGKTTLARMLLLDGIEAGYQPFEIESGGLHDMWELLELDEKQIFYFDDFLGRTALFESREQDQDLVRFLRRIVQDPKRRIVLTTREYILAQAHRVSEALDLETDGGHPYLLTAERYTRYEQARIFYNHVYFSPRLDAKAKESLVLGGGYLDVIDHPNYNPRLVEWMTGLSISRISEEEKADYATYCLNVLNAPERIWGHTFERGLGDHERALLIALLGLPPRVDVEMTEAAFEAACKARGLPLAGRPFVRALAVLDDSLIASDEERLRLINPSLIDFLEEYLRNSPADTVAALRSACYFDQLAWLWRAAREDDELPPEPLWPEYLDAFSRLMDAPPDRDEAFDLMREHPITKLGFRLRLVARLLDQGPWREGAASWLPAYAEKWLDELVELEGPDPSEVILLLRLLEHGMLDGERAGPIAKSRVTELEEGTRRWKLLGDLCRVRPELFSEREKAENREELAGFVKEVFETLGETIFWVVEFDELIEAADSWGVTLDPSTVQARRTELEELEEEEIFHGEEEEEMIEAEREADWLAQRKYKAKMNNLPTPEEEEEQIDSMFVRLIG